MKKILILLTLLFLKLCIYAQFHYPIQIGVKLETPPEKIPDTLYFPYMDDIQLIIIDKYQTYRSNVLDTCIMEQFPYLPENQLSNLSENQLSNNFNSQRFRHFSATKNIYLFRNQQGRILNVYNVDTIYNFKLRNSDFINSNKSDSTILLQNLELNNYLIFNQVNDKVGLINLKGEIVVPAIYDEIKTIKFLYDEKPKLLVFKNNRFGFLDVSLNQIFQPIYSMNKDGNSSLIIDEITIQNKYLKVYKDGKCGLISSDGEVLIDFLYDDVRHINDSLMIWFLCRDKNELNYTIKEPSRWGYCVKGAALYDRNINLIKKLDNYEYVDWFYLNEKGGILVKVIIIKKNNKFGVLNLFGEILIPLEYDMITIEDNVFIVTKNNKKGILNLEGESVMPCEYESIDFYGTAIYVTQKGLIGVFNRQYKLIAEPQFKSRDWSFGRYILTKRNGSEGYVEHRVEDSYYESPEGERIQLDK